MSPPRLAIALYPFLILITDLLMISFTELAKSSALKLMIELAARLQ